MRDSIISTLYKNKGDRSDRNNYRSISLLCITGKLFARVALYRLQKIAERVYPESVNCGHDFLFETALGEVQRATTAAPHCIHRLDEGV